MNSAPCSSSIEVLLVEDNPGDVRLTREALKDDRVCNSLSVVLDGVEAMAFLHREGRYAGAPRPDLILLDLNLPRKTGREVLEEVRADAALRTIPIVVITASEAERQVGHQYALNADCYVTKPVGLEELIAVVKAVDGFWLSVVRIPAGEHP